MMSGLHSKNLISFVDSKKSPNTINAKGFDLSNVKVPVEAEAIMVILPQKHPTLLVDRVLEINAERIVATKAVSMGEFCMIGHFPGEPVYPGVYTLESLAQACTLLGYFLACHPIDPKEFQLAVRMVTVDDVKFKREILPGDLLEITAVHLSTRSVRGSIFHRFHAVGYVNGVEVAEAKMMGYFFNRLDKVVTI